MQINPVPLLLGETVLVEFPDGDHIVVGRGLAVRSGDRVAVDVQRRREAVVIADLLKLVVGQGQPVGIQQADIGQRRRISTELRGVGSGARIIGLWVYLLYRVCRAGRLDVAADVGRLTGRLVRPNLELLDDRRIDSADHQG